MTTKLITIRRTFDITLPNKDRWRFDVIDEINHIQRDISIVCHDISAFSLRAIQNRTAALQQLYKLLEEEGTLVKNDEGYFEPNPERR